MMMTICDKVEKWCGKHSMLPRGGKVLCALSGGADSVALLRILITLADKYELTVEAAHFNHCLRGEESLRDERFTTELCERLGVHIETGREDVASAAGRMGMGTEETARHLRYGFLTKTAKERGCAAVATAHNALDNAETILMNLARGSGAKGLCGIPPVRDMFIRPVLCLERSEIEAYLNRIGQPWVEDSTNHEDIYTRNRVRHHILPELCDINKGAVGNMLQASELIRQDDELLNELAENFLAEFAPGEVSAKALKEQPFSIASRAVRVLAGVSLSHERVMSVLKLAKEGSSGSKIELGGSLEARLEQGMVRFARGEYESFAPVSLTLGDNYLPRCSMSVQVRYEPCLKEEKTNRFHFEVRADAYPFEVRPRKTGDKLKLKFRQGTKSLKKLFIEEKIPLGKRGLVPVLACEKGVMAVPGIGVDEDFRARKGESAYIIIFKEE